MYELINAMVKAHEKDAVHSKVKPKNAQSLRRAITELAAQENAKVPVERRVTQRDIEVVASRSLNSTTGLERPSRFFAAYREVASFIALATTGATPTRVTPNRDLLVIGHPLSTRTHAMTASAYSEAVARWIAADPRIADEARPLVASVYMTGIGSVDYEHAVARLVALPAGLVPQDIIIASASPLEAILGFGGNDSVSRSARARMQRRDRKGRFAEQGGGMQFFVRLASGKIASVVGKFLTNSDKTEGFQIQVRNDKNVPNGIYDVDAQKVEAVKALLPEDALPDTGVEVVLPPDTDAVDIADLTPVDVPTGWTLLKEKAEGEEGPDKVFKTDDGYRVDWYAPGTDKTVLDKAIKDAQTSRSQSNQPLDGPKVLFGNLSTLDIKSQQNRRKPEWDFNEPFFMTYRDDPDEIVPVQAVGLSQTWADSQQHIEWDEKYYEAAREKSAAKKESIAEADKKNKAYWENVKQETAEQKKINADTRGKIQSNLSKGLDPFGNKIPDGWEVNVDDAALNPYESDIQAFPIKPEETVSYTRAEQGYTGSLRHTADGGLEGLYQDQKFDNWNDAQDGFAETVEADVNNRREAALDVVESYDESGDIRSMIENGASPDEVLEKLRENKKWSDREDDYQTRGFVDLPQPAQKASWNAFEKDLNAIRNMPPEFAPFGEEKTDEVKAQLPETTAKKITELKPGDVFINDIGKNKGKQQKIEKISSVDSGLMVSFRDADTKKMMYRIFEDPTNETVSVVPSEEPIPAPEPTPPAAPTPTAPAAEKKSDDINWILPDGAFNLYRADEYEPEGRTDQESPDYTDDPKVLANKFDAQTLRDALAQAVIGVKDYATEFLDEFFDDLDDEEEGEVKSKPGPKKKKPKSKNATGFGQLDFDFGEELVPAEAIYSALLEQGEDAELLAAELYDLPSGESKNVDMLEGLRSP